MVPTEVDSKFLSNAIEKASKEHNSPTFQPHVTLFTLPSEPVAKPTDKLISSTKSIVKKVVAPLTLEQDEVKVGETYHQSVFLKLKENENVNKLRKDLMKSVGVTDDTITHDYPHASLYYGNGSADVGPSLSSLSMIFAYAYHLGQAPYHYVYDGFACD